MVSKGDGGKDIGQNGNHETPGKVEKNRYYITYLLSTVGIKLVLILFSRYDRMGNCVTFELLPTRQPINSASA